MTTLTLPRGHIHCEPYTAAEADLLRVNRARWGTYGGPWERVRSSGFSGRMGPIRTRELWAMSTGTARDAWKPLKLVMKVDLATRSTRIVNLARIIFSLSIRPRTGTSYSLHILLRLSFREGFMCWRCVIGNISVLSFCMLVCASTATSQTLTLPYRPVTAEYSNALDRIIFIAASPNQLHIFDPVSNTDTPVNLPKPPLSLSLSLDGMHAAVGHDGLISYVNLQTMSLEKTLPASVTVTSLVLGNGWVYVLTYSAGTLQIQISTGQSQSSGVYNGTFGRLHPSGSAIYTTEDGSSPEHLQDLNVSTGPITTIAQGPYHGDYAV